MKDDKPPEKKQKSKCFNIFCCGYCCSKESGPTANEKHEEANLSKPEKNKEIKIKKDKSKKGTGYVSNEEQDISIEEEN
jgi:hypothetical protein